MSDVALMAWLAGGESPPPSILQASIDAAHSVDPMLSTAAAIKAYEGSLVSTVEGRDRLAYLINRDAP